MYHNHFSKNEFSLHRGYLGKNYLRSWREDPSGQEHRATFLFSPASIRYAKKTPIKNRWSYTNTHHYGPPLPILPLFLPSLTPQTLTSSPITIMTPVIPRYCFGAKRFVNKLQIVRSVSTFHDAISWNPDKFDAYSTTNSYNAERDWRTIIQIRIATSLVVSKRGGHLQFGKRLKDYYSNTNCDSACRFERGRTYSVEKEIEGLLFKNK